MRMRFWVGIVALLCLFMMGMAFLIQIVFEVPLEEIAETLVRQAGWPGALAVILLLSIDLLLPIPSSLVMILSGAIFGGWLGGGVAFVGSMIGNTAGYELAGRFGRSFAQRAAGAEDLRNYKGWLESYGPWAVILSRPVPIVMETVSLTAGLAGMCRGTFLISSSLGTLPVCLLYAFAGSWSWDLGSALPGLVLFLCLPGLGWLLVRKRLGHSGSMAGGEEGA